MSESRSSESNVLATEDTTPSPWLPCPECAGVWFKAFVTLERGNWLDEDTYQVDLETPPHVSTYQSGHEMIECNNCGHKFGLVDVGYVDARAEEEE